MIIFGAILFFVLICWIVFIGPVVRRHGFKNKIPNEGQIGKPLSKPDDFFDEIKLKEKYIKASTKSLSQKRRNKQRKKRLKGRRFLRVGSSRRYL